MHDWRLRTPVAFIIFNRPDVTQRVFSVIAKMKPPKLLVVADGPRPCRDGEIQKCAATRAILDQVDWKCEILRNFSDINLGCKVRVSTGLDWVFEQVPEAIILEDDCLPHPTFFRFCEELLERYRDDHSIGMISGDNFQFGQSRTESSYYFSRYNHIWGWASWRRAWKKYDRKMRKWPKTRNSRHFRETFTTPAEFKFWRKIFDKTHAGKVDTWDYQWTFTLRLHDLLTVLPDVNLVSNIGFGAEATHTNRESAVANMPAESMAFPLSHPDNILVAVQADRTTFRKVIYQSLPRRLTGVLSNYFGNNGA